MGFFAGKGEVAGGGGNFDMKKSYLKNGQKKYTANTFFLQTQNIAIKLFRFLKTIPPPLS